MNLIMDKSITYNGIRLHYTLAGAGQPLFLLHGWGCNAETFKMSLTDFFDWLYEHPAEEKAMMQEMIDESARRAALAIPKKKE